MKFISPYLFNQPALQAEFNNFDVKVQKELLDIKESDFTSTSDDRILSKVLNRCRPRVPRLSSPRPLVDIKEIRVGSDMLRITQGALITARVQFSGDSYFFKYTPSEYGTTLPFGTIDHDYISFVIETTPEDNHDEVLKAVRDNINLINELLDSHCKGIEALEDKWSDYVQSQIGARRKNIKHMDNIDRTFSRGF